MSSKPLPRRLFPALVVTCVAALAVLPLLRGRAGDEKLVRQRFRPSGIDGALVIAGGGKLPDVILERFVQLAGGEKAHLVIIPTAADGADKQPADKLLAPWQARKVASAVVLNTRSKQTANDPEFSAPLRKATGVWFGGGQQARLADAYLDTAVEKELNALLKRGGVIGGSSAGAAILSKAMIASGNAEPKMGRGFDLLPGTIIDQHFVKRDRKGRLFKALEKNAGLVGVGVDEGTALIVKGRELRVVGDSSVTVCLAASPTLPARTIELRAGKVGDLTALRRAAIARAEPPFPPKQPPAPNVARGSLLIHGGGGLSAATVKKFIELAGGPDALIVVLPTAGEDPLPKRINATAFLERAGARNVHELRARELKDVEDPKTLALLKKARGVWFGGGRQWRFVDAYEGTRAYALFHDVLRRGGVIGGSSAGATIQGDYLCRGSPFGNLDIMYEGYERGFAFLPGTAIDQHFTQRKRLPDMAALMKTYPQLLGIGIDEATALIVRGHVAEMMGRGQVHFYDATRPRDEGAADHVSVGAGGRYDLKGRRVLKPAQGK